MSVTEAPITQIQQGMAALVASRRGVTARVNDTDLLVADRILEALPSLGYVRMDTVIEQLRVAAASREDDRRKATMEILAAHQWLPSARRCGCGAQVGDFALDHAAHVLDVLAGMGATIALPQEPTLTVPHTPDEHGRKDWVTPIGEVTVFDDGEARIDSAYAPL